MLNSEGEKNFKRIRLAAKEIWGDNCQFGDIQVENAPFCMFQIPLLIYRRFNVLLIYDRSILDISVKLGNEYHWLADLTQKPIIEGFESCKIENLLTNFIILDETIKSLK